MATISTPSFKTGTKVLVEGDPCNMVAVEFVKPGKGQAFSRIKFKNLISGRVWERTLKSGETLELADVSEESADFLYDDGQEWHFMNKTSFEQYAVTAEIVSETKNWLLPEMECQVTLFNGSIIAVTPPTTVELQVTYTEPGMKGDTVTGGTKPATLETGVSINVPLFVNIDDRLKVDTRTAKYLSRAGK